MSRAVVVISPLFLAIKRLTKTYVHYRYYQSSLPTQFSVLCGLLRLTTKYAVDDVRAEVVAHFSKKYPSTLEGLDRLLEPAVVTNILYSHTPGNSLLREILSLVQLVREVSAEILLPCIFLELARLLSHIDASALASRIHDPMHLRTIIKSMKGREQLILATRRLVLAFIDGPSPEQCASKAKCQSSKQARFGRIDICSFYSEHARGFIPAEKVVANWAQVICPPCLDAFRVSVDAGRHELWDGLPKCFGLPPWEDLKKRS